MVPNIVEPNQFVLQGIGHNHKDMHINYSTTSKTGKLIFNYKDSKGAHNFTGAGISTQKTEIGMLVTVLFEAVPDFHAMMLTLLVSSQQQNVV